MGGHHHLPCAFILVLRKGSSSILNAPPFYNSISLVLCFSSNNLLETPKSAISSVIGAIIYVLMIFGDRKQSITGIRTIWFHRHSKRAVDFFVPQGNWRHDWILLRHSFVKGWPLLAGRLVLFKKRHDYQPRPWLRLDHGGVAGSYGWRTSRSCALTS